MVCWRILQKDGAKWLKKKKTTKNALPSNKPAGRKAQVGKPRVGVCACVYEPESQPGSTETTHKTSFSLRSFHEG